MSSIRSGDIRSVQNVMQRSMNASSSADAAEQDCRIWKMRISCHWNLTTTIQKAAIISSTQIPIRIIDLQKHKAVLIIPEQPCFLSCVLLIFGNSLYAEKLCYLNAQIICGDAEYEPVYREKKTYLSEKIKWETGIIPYLPVHYNVVEYSHRELDSGYHKGACQAVSHKIQRTAAEDIEQCEDDPACDTHSPVSIAPAGYFHKGIKEESHKK